DRDAEISRYFNTQLAGGKWSHMMDQTHIGYTYWQEPPRNVMPRVDVIQVPAAAEMGVAYEGQPALPAFDSYQRQSHYIEVYNRGQAPFEFTARAAEPWVVISPASGTVQKEQRLTVSVDWSRVPNGTH